MNDIMIDLETMGTSHDAAIIAIGAVAFDPVSGSIGAIPFYSVVDLQSSVNCGGVIEPSSILWWMSQSDAARLDLVQGGKHINVALTAFSQWIADVCDEAPIVWGNGADFDNVILASVYRHSHLECPWKFWNSRCYRTLKNLRPDIAFEREGTHHNALDDARSQALHAIKIFASLKGGA